MGCFGAKMLDKCANFIKLKMTAQKFRPGEAMVCRLYPRCCPARACRAAGSIPRYPPPTFWRPTGHGSTAPAQSQTSHCHESFESLVQNSNKPPLRRPLPSPAPMRREKTTCRQYPLRQSLQRMHRSALQQQGSYLGQMHCEASSPAARAPQLLFAAALQAPLTAAPAAHPILARHCLFPPEAAW